MAFVFGCVVVLASLYLWAFAHYSHKGDLIAALVWWMAVLGGFTMGMGLFSEK